MPYMYISLLYVRVYNMYMIRINEKFFILYENIIILVIVVETLSCRVN